MNKHIRIIGLLACCYIAWTGGILQAQSVENGSDNYLLKHSVKVGAGVYTTPAPQLALEWHIGRRMSLELGVQYFHDQRAEDYPFPLRSLDSKVKYINFVTRSNLDNEMVESGTLHENVKIPVMPAYAPLWTARYHLGWRKYLVVGPKWNYFFQGMLTAAVHEYALCEQREQFVSDMKVQYTDQTIHYYSFRQTTRIEMNRLWLLGGQLRWGVQYLLKNWLIEPSFGIQVQPDAQFQETKLQYPMRFITLAGQLQMGYRF